LINDLSSLRLGIGESEEGSEVVRSTLIANMAINDISNGNAVIVIDPAGTLSDAILCAVDEEDLERIVYCSIDFPQCFNLFELKKKNLNDKDGKEEGILIEDFFSLVDKIVAGGTSTQPLTARMRDAFRTALEVVLKEPRPTFDTLFNFMAMKEFRKGLLNKHEISDYTKNAWKEGGTFAGRQPDVSVIGGIDRLRMFTGSSSISRLCSGESTVDFNDILDNNKVFILNLDKSGNFIKFLGCLFLHGLQSIILYTSRKARPVAIYCDEFQNFITPDFQRFFNEGRKYMLSMCLAHQVHTKEAEQIVNVCLSNAGAKITFRAGSREAERISREFVSVRANEIISLKKYHVFCVIDNKSYYFKARRAPVEQREIEDVDKWLVENFKVVVEVKDKKNPEESFLSEPVKEPEEEKYIGFEWFRL